MEPVKNEDIIHIEPVQNEDIHTKPVINGDIPMKPVKMKIFICN